MPITGVMPLPGGDEQRSAGARARQDEVAGRLVEVDQGSRARARRTTWLLTLPSGMALTVIAMQPVGPGRPGR